MDPLENTQNIGQPKLPDDYWVIPQKESQSISNIFDENINVSLKDISIFKND